VISGHAPLGGAEPAAVIVQMDTTKSESKKNVTDDTIEIVFKREQA
jgi:hypothetical protein